MSMKPLMKMKPPSRSHHLLSLCLIVSPQSLPSYYRPYYSY